MEWAGAIASTLDLAMHEIALFAACGFLVLGLGDLAVDLIWIGRTLWRRITVYRRHARASADCFPAAQQPGQIAIFVPAWDEADVIAVAGQKFRPKIIGRKAA